MTRAAKFKRLDQSAILPSYAYPGDAGMDFAILGNHTLGPGESRDLPSGLAVEFPPGYWGRITGRSSTLRERGLFINEGVIDSGYRGELKTYVTNRNATPAHIEHGTRLAQLVLSPVIQTDTMWVDELSPSLRGVSGFGSTGTKAIEVYRRHEHEVYLGGPIDYVAGSDEHAWRHLRPWADLDIYCPVCANSGGADAIAIGQRNLEALMNSYYGVFDLRMAHASIGTPVEIEFSVARPDGFGRTIIVHPFDRSQWGVFVKWWEHRGAVIFGSFEEAGEYVVAGVAGVVSPLRSGG